jgi:hypothetical protein
MKTCLRWSVMFLSVHKNSNYPLWISNKMCYFFAFPLVQNATPFMPDQPRNFAQTGTSEEHMALDSLFLTSERVGGCLICVNVFLHQQKTYKRRNKLHEFSCHQPVMNLHAYLRNQVVSSLA